MIEILKYWWNPNKFIREDGQSKLASWSKKVRSRDKYKCQCCGVQSKLILTCPDCGSDKPYRKKCFDCGREEPSYVQMEAHHNESKAFNPRLWLRVSNGTTLCKKCHAEFHEHMGGTRVETTTKDLHKWISCKNKSNNKDSNIGFNIFMVLIIVVLIVFILEGLGVIG